MTNSSTKARLLLVTVFLGAGALLAPLAAQSATITASVTVIETRRAEQNRSVALSLLDTGFAGWSVRARRFDTGNATILAAAVPAPRPGSLQATRTVDIYYW